MKRPFTLVAALVAVMAGVSPDAPALRAQPRPSALVATDTGHVALGLAIRRLHSVGAFLQTDAHPDDENNALLAWLTRGLGMRAAVLTLTRGNGGQNEIGAELFEDLAVVRTSELLAAHRLDGADQYFGRAIDFGFSFSTEETFRKWGRAEILADVVRHLRTIRPDVILAMSPTGEGGGQHHQATALLAADAFRAAADPAQFPGQIADGLRPWQAKKLYFGGGPPPGAMGAVGIGPAAKPGRLPPPMAGGPGSARSVKVDANVYDPLLGRTFNEIGVEARGFHKCQGAGQIVPLPGPAPATYVLGDTVIPGHADKVETGLFDGIDTSLPGLAQYVGGTVPDGLTSGLAAIAGHAAAAQQAFESAGDRATQRPILAGLAAVRALRARLGSMGLDDQARFDIDLRLQAKERDFQDASIAAFGLVLRALADDGLVLAGQSVNVTLFAANHAGTVVELADASVIGFGERQACPDGAIATGRSYSCSMDVRVPVDVPLTAPHWKPLPGVSRSVFDADVPFGAPFRPSPFRAVFRFTLGGQDVSADLPVMFRYQQDMFTGEKHMELNVVPAYSVKTMPVLAIVPLRPAVAGPKGSVREVQVAVTSGLTSPSEATVALAVPAGWTVTPAGAPVAFAHEDQTRTVRFQVTIPAGAATGQYRLRATVTAPAPGSATFDRGYQVVDYPHIQRRHVINLAETTVNVLDVQTTPGIRVGYIVGVGDQVPTALEQLGAALSFIGEDELAWGDLSAYDVIVTGVRAYERRGDLRANNRRLIDFAERGGTVVVQYNKLEFNQTQYGPYPARVGTGRVTDEQAPVTVLRPNHPLFTYPNRIGEGTWQGWVQERGLYFLGEKDPRYVDLVQLEDPFPYNKGTKSGALVEATVGQGRWIYVGLSLWRQVPAGTAGAYQLLANLISLPKAPKAPAPRGGTTGQ